MALQKFVATKPHTFDNGAIGWAPGGYMDCLGPFAKVQNCPIAGTELRRTAYASDYPDTFFSVPARIRGRDGKAVNGFFAADQDGPVFNPLTSEAHRV